MELLAAGVSRFFTASSPPHPDAKVWAKPLASPKGSIAVGLLNRPHATIRPVPLAALACARTERCRCSQVALLNRADSAATNQSATITADWAAIGAPPTRSFDVLDLWADAASIGTHVGSLSATVPPSSAKLYKLVPA